MEEPGRIDGGMSTLSFACRHNNDSKSFWLTHCMPRRRE